MLKSAYGRCLELAEEHRCGSVAFPSLSTGAYRFPIDKASRIALRTAIDFLENHDHPKVVRFVLFDQPAFDAFEGALTELTAT